LSAAPARLASRHPEPPGQADRLGVHVVGHRVVPVGRRAVPDPGPADHSPAGAGLMPAGGTLDRTSAVLNDLLNNTLDPGYRVAAGRARRRRWWDGPLVWLCCLAAGL